MLTMSLYIKRWIENGKIDTTKERGLYQYKEKEVNSDSEECLLSSRSIHCTGICSMCNLKNYVLSLSWPISFWKFILSRCQYEFSFVESMLPRCQHGFPFVESMLSRCQRQFSFVESMLSLSQRQFLFVESLLPRCQRQFLFVESMLPRRQRQFLFCRTAPHTLWEWFSFYRIEVHSQLGLNFRLENDTNTREATIFCLLEADYLVLAMYFDLKNVVYRLLAIVRDVETRPYTLIDFIYSWWRYQVNGDKATYDTCTTHSVGRM